MNVKQNAVAFLQGLGFDDVRPLQGPEVRMLVRGAIKTVRKCLKAKNMKFTLIEQSTVPSATVHKYFVIENRKVIGHLHLTAYVTHSVVELINV